MIMDLMLLRKVEQAVADMEQMNATFTKDELNLLLRAVICVLSDYPNTPDDIRSCESLKSKLEGLINSSPEDTGAKIIARLTKVELVAKLISSAPLEIKGGSSSETSGDFVMYENPFKIWEGLSDGKVSATRSYFASSGQKAVSPAYQQPEEAVGWLIATLHRAQFIPQGR